MERIVDGAVLLGTRGSAGFRRGKSLDFAGVAFPRSLGTYQNGQKDDGKRERVAEVHPELSAKKGEGNLRVGTGCW